MVESGLIHTDDCRIVARPRLLDRRAYTLRLCLERCSDCGGARRDHRRLPLLAIDPNGVPRYRYCVVGHGLGRLNVSITLGHQRSRSFCCRQVTKDSSGTLRRESTVVEDDLGMEPCAACGSLFDERIHEEVTLASLIGHP